MRDTSRGTKGRARIDPLRGIGVERVPFMAQAAVGEPAPIRQMPPTRRQQPQDDPGAESPAIDAPGAPDHPTAPITPLPGRHAVVVEPKRPVWTPDDQARFDEWWALYPLKVGKKDCLMWWKRHRPGDDLFGRMIAALERRIAVDPEFANGERLACANPHTYLNGERWDDEIKPRAERRGGAGAAIGDDFVAARDRYVAARGPQVLYDGEWPDDAATPQPEPPPPVAPTGTDLRPLYAEFDFREGDQAKYRAMVAGENLSHELRATIFYPPQGTEPAVILFVNAEQARAVTVDRGARARIHAALRRYYPARNPGVRLWHVGELRELMRQQEG